MQFSWSKLWFQILKIWKVMFINSLTIDVQLVTELALFTFFRCHCTSVCVLRCDFRSCDNRVFPHFSERQHKKWMFRVVIRILWWARHWHCFCFRKLPLSLPEEIQRWCKRRSYLWQLKTAPDEETAELIEISSNFSSLVLNILMNAVNFP